MEAPSPEKILKALPYGPGFRFVDGLTHLSEDAVEGYYTFAAKAPYYAHHFPGHPVTPGVLLTECMAQIGLVCLGYYLLHAPTAAPAFALSESHVLYQKIVPPQTTVTVKARKIYWRLGKLKCEVALYLPSGICACRGTLAGVLTPKKTS